jgi:hypothetical protein
MPKSIAEQRKDAAKLLASIGGKNGTGAAKARSKAHYKRLADIKKLEKKIRMERSSVNPVDSRLAKLENQLSELREKR